MSKGTIYTETVVYSAPAEYVADAPYQIAIVSLDQEDKRLTARIAGERVQIGDAVEFVETRAGYPVYRKQQL